MQKIMLVLLSLILQQSTWAADVIEITADQLPGSYHIENSRNKTKFAFATLGTESIIVEFILEDQDTVKCESKYNFDKTTLTLTSTIKNCSGINFSFTAELKGIDYDLFSTGAVVPFEISYDGGRMPGQATIRRYNPFVQ